MNYSPERPSLSPYEETAVHLLTRVDELLTARGVQQRHGHNLGPRSQELQLTEDELEKVGPIFTSHVLDAPEKLKIWLATDYPVDSPRPRLTCREVLFISTEHEDVTTDYNVWIEPGHEPLVMFRKDAVRITPSPKPYTIGAAACEAEYHEQLSKDTELAAYEQEALFEVIDLLMSSCKPS